MIQHRLSGTNPPTQASNGMPNENSKNNGWKIVTFVVAFFLQKS